MLIEVYIIKDLLYYIIFQVLLKNSFPLLINLFSRTEKYREIDYGLSESREHTQTGYKTSHTFSVPFSLAADRETIVLLVIPASVPKPKPLISVPAFQLCWDIKQKPLIQNEQ